MKKPLVLVIFMLVSGYNLAQNYAEILKSDSTKIHIGGYVDVYYGYDFNRPQDKNRPYFVSSARHNEIAVNLAMLDFKFVSPRVRAIIRPSFGTFMQANYQPEPAMFRFLYEANAGIKLSKKKDFWIDGGIFYSPYTNESAISKDHLLYTRSFAPEYVPYYLCGLRASVPVNEKINLYFYFLNGWQVIQDNSNKKSAGTQIEIKLSDKWLFNWNTFIGDSRTSYRPLDRMRYFSDIFFIYNNEGKFSATGCIYYGHQQRTDTTGKKEEAGWWSANLNVRFRFDKTHSVSARAEVFDDPKMVQVIPVTGVNGFNCFSSSLGYNWQVNDNALVRLEGRYFTSPKEVFINANQVVSKTSALIISSLAVWF